MFITTELHELMLNTPGMLDIIVYCALIAICHALRVYSALNRLDARCGVPLYVNSETLGLQLRPQVSEFAWAPRI